MYPVTRIFSITLTLSLLGCSSVPSDNQQRITITKSLDTRQCESNEDIKKVRVSGLKDTLETQHIQVYSARVGNDGNAHIAMCGADDGSIGIFTIPEKQLNEARQLGFQPDSTNHSR